MRKQYKPVIEDFFPEHFRIITFRLQGASNVDYKVVTFVIYESKLVHRVHCHKIMILYFLLSLSCYSFSSFRFLYFLPFHLIFPFSFPTLFIPFCLFQILIFPPISNLIILFLLPFCQCFLFYYLSLRGGKSFLKN